MLNSNSIRHLPAIIGASALLFVGACSSAVKAESQHADLSSSKSAHMGETDSGYSKPGPGITVRNNYSGQSAVGVAQEIQFDLRDAYPSGILKVQVLPSDNLTVTNTALEQSFQMSGDETNSFTVTVTPKSEGQYVLNLLLTVDQGVGNFATMSSSVSIYSGSETFLKGETKEIGFEKSQAIGGIKSMAAEETIIQ